MQIKDMSYLSLVNTLLNPISPEIRGLILERLIEMNNQLKVKQLPIQLIQENSLPEQSPDREICEKKLCKPDYQIPKKEMRETSDMQDIYFNKLDYKNYLQTKTDMINFSIPEVDLDDIINDINDKSKDYAQLDDLDKKLLKIKDLHKKIITNKKRRRKNRMN